MHFARNSFERFMRFMVGSYPRAERGWEMITAGKGFGSDGLDRIQILTRVPVRGSKTVRVIGVPPVRAGHVSVFPGRIIAGLAARR